MADIVPLSDWYPAMYDKWVASNRRRVRPEDRERWIHHHTGGGTGLNPLAYARRVADDHWDEWGRPGGYNFFIGEDATIFEMCGWDWWGVHSGTHYWNEHGFGLAYQGNFMSRQPSTAMLHAARDLMGTFSLPQSYHRAVRPTYTDCPGDALIALLPLELDMAHTHEPPRSDLPRDWADDAWDQWVARSGTDPASRTWDFYREDLSWVYQRAIAPLERKIDELTARVRQLENQSGSGGLTEAQVKALIAQSRIVP